MNMIIFFSPERILADKIYRNRDNLQYCEKLNIRMNGPKLGRPLADKTIYAEQKWLERLDAGGPFLGRQLMVNGLYRQILDLVGKLTGFALPACIGDVFQCRFGGFGIGCIFSFVEMIDLFQIAGLFAGRPIQPLFLQPQLFLIPFLLGSLLRNNLILELNLLFQLLDFRLRIML